MRLTIATATAVLLASASVVSAASFTVFADRAAFLAAAGTVQTENFNDAPLGQFDFGTPYQFNGFTITGTPFPTGTPIGLGITNDATAANALDGTALLAWTQRLFGGRRNGPDITFDFDSMITAFGFDWLDVDNTDSYKLVVLGEDIGAADGEVPFPRRNSVGTSGFFGLISDTPFDSLQLAHVRKGGVLERMGMDNVVLSEIRTIPTPEPVPVPAALPLMATAIGALALFRRRQNGAAN